MVSKTDPSKKVVLYQGVWAFCLDKYQQIIIPSKPEQLTENPSAKYIMVQQDGSGETEAGAIPGFKLIENQYIPEPVKLFGIPLSKTYPGYQVAIYEKE